MENTFADLSKSKLVLGYRPKISFEDGMNEFYKWYKKNIMKYKRLGIIGYGFVGKATDYGFSIKTKKLFVDPKLNTSLDSLKDFDPEIIFVATDTYE